MEEKCHDRERKTLNLALNTQRVVVCGSWARNIRPAATHWYSGRVISHRTSPSIYIFSYPMRLCVSVCLCVGQHISCLFLFFYSLSLLSLLLFFVGFQKLCEFMGLLLLLFYFFFEIVSFPPYTVYPVDTFNLFPSSSSTSSQSGATSATPNYYTLSKRLGVYKYRERRGTDASVLVYNCDGNIYVYIYIPPHHRLTHSPWRSEFLKYYFVFPIFIFFHRESSVFFSFIFFYFSPSFVFLFLFFSPLFVRFHPRAHRLILRTRLRYPKQPPLVSELPRAHPVSRGCASSSREEEEEEESKLVFLFSFLSFFFERILFPMDDDGWLILHLSVYLSLRVSFVFRDGGP